MNPILILILKYNNTIIRLIKNNIYYIVKLFCYNNKKLNIGFVYVRYKITPCRR